MNQARLLAAVLLLLHFSAAPARADISAAQFRGFGIEPVGSPDIRMESAKVDIVWGTPCQLTAVFVMDNQSAHPADVQVGFPLDLPEDLYDKRKLNFAMSFDGLPVPREKISGASQTPEKFHRETMWYYCAHTFPPGKTVVTVQTRLPAGANYLWLGAENLSYCIRTGASWKGTIGSEEVNIHFPGPVSKREVLYATPAGYQIDGNTVRWRFHDFEPHGLDHDIELSYLRPDVLPTLARLREKVAREPANTRAKLALVKNLFALGIRQGCALLPPHAMDKAEYREIIGKFRDHKTRASFQAAYFKKRDGTYQRRDELMPQKKWDAMMNALIAADHTPHYARSAEVDEARALLEGLLRDQPHNAKAWNLYLANDYRMHYTGRNYYDGGDYNPSQVERIETAYRNCPTDQCIRLRHEIGQMLGSTANPSDETSRAASSLQSKLYELLNKQGVFTPSFEKPDIRW